MSKQNKNLIALAVLVIATLISWRYNRIPAQPHSVIKTMAAKAVQQDNPLKARFRKIRLEMDALYHYRSKPAAFIADPSPFRLPPGMETSEMAKGPAFPSGGQGDKAVQVVPTENVALEAGDALLSHAISLMHIGGMITMNSVSQIAINGQLRKQGDVFTVRVQTRLVLIKVRALAPGTMTLALDDPDAGTASARLKLK
jgi:hypothetical protein